MLNLRVADDPLEILSTLNKMYLERSPVLLWQHLPGAPRLMANSYIKSIDFSGNKILLAPMGRGSKFDFDQKHSIYIRGNEKSILFKHTGVRADRQNVEVDIPEEVRMLEKRTFPRTKFGFDGPHDALIMKRVNLTGQKYKEFSFRIFDMSTQGASFIFSSKEQIYFAPGDRIFIKSVGPYSWPSGIEAEVIYVKRVEFLSDGHRISKMRMGVRLKRQLTESVLEGLTPP